MGGKKLLGLMVIGAATIGMSSMALAAKGGGGGGGAVSVVVTDGVFGGTTDATVVSAADPTQLALASSGTEYWVRGQCSQNGRVVYEQFLKTAGGVATLQLGPTALWTDGSADCTADTGYLKRGIWASTASSPFVAWAAG